MKSPEPGKLLKVISWFDKMRWDSKTNYNILDNQLYNKLNPHQKILVHWLCYITDRQMPYEKVWVEGSKFFSAIVYEYSQADKGYDYINQLKIYRKKDHKNSSIEFYFNSKYNFTYTSRFITTDLFSILLTLIILDDYDHNIIKYLNLNFNKFFQIIREVNNANEINLLAFLLHILSYHFVVNKQAGSDLESYLQQVPIVNKNVSDILLSKDLSKFRKEYQLFVNNRFKGKKRTWCCIRDYLKSKHDFNKEFVWGIKELDDSENLLNIFGESKNSFLKYLELPGDVWNLNDNFIRKLITPHLNLKSGNIPRSLRMAIDSIDNTGKYYPEQFDFSFEFVPRMCASPVNIVNNGKMCSICVFGKSGMEAYCHHNEGELCPVTMITCGFINKCRPDTCQIKNGKGLCEEITCY